MAFVPSWVIHAANRGKVVELNIIQIQELKDAGYTVIDLGEKVVVI